MAKSKGTTTSSVADLLARKLDASPKKLWEIAAEVGFPKPNILSMIKTGVTKVPLDKAPALALAIGLDPARFVRLCLQEYMPEAYAAISKHLEFVTENERRILGIIRQQVGDSDPALSAAGMKTLSSWARGLVA